MANADSAVTTFYYPIQYPFSVDRDRDLRDPMSPSGHMSRMVNFIPRGQILRTRGGIIELEHVPETPVAAVGNDFSGDSNCLCVWKLNAMPANVAGDSKGSNDMLIHSSVGTSYITIDTTNFPTSYLSASLSLDNNPTLRSAWLTCTFANQTTTLPGSVGENTTFSVCAWVRQGYVMGGNQFGIVGKYSATARQWILRNSPFTDRFNFVLTDTVMTNYQCTATGTPTIGNWYHILATFSSATKTATIRVVNSSGASVGSANVTLPNGMTSYNSDLEIGTYGSSPSVTWDGNIGEVVFFNDVVTDAEQDQIVAGTYSG